jgi:glycosyltransferase involved in cell wall biosynthesis
VLFLGALDVVTNQSALEWFTTQVWPGVRERFPTAILDVVGRRPPESLRAQIAGTAGAELHADVPDVRPYLDDARVAVNPAVTGSGVNIKLVEYLQAGVPVVSTALATRGLDLRPGQDLEVHDEPKAFADAVVGLLRDPQRAGRLADSGLERVTELLDPKRNLELMAAAFAIPFVNDVRETGR